MKLSDRDKQLLVDWMLPGAKRYAAVVLQVVSTFGEEGKELVRKVNSDFGREYGIEAAKRAQRRDLQEFYEFFVKPIYESSINPPEIIEKSEKRLIYRGTWCPYAESFRKMGLNAKEMSELYELFCEPFDTAIRTGFNPKIKFKHTKNMIKGDKYCEYYAELE